MLCPKRIETANNHQVHLQFNFRLNINTIIKENVKSSEKIPFCNACENYGHSRITYRDCKKNKNRVNEKLIYL